MNAGTYVIRPMKPTPVWMGPDPLRDAFIAFHAANRDAAYFNDEQDGRKEEPEHEFYFDGGGLVILGFVVSPKDREALGDDIGDAYGTILTMPFKSGDPAFEKLDKDAFDKRIADLTERQKDEA